MLEFTAPALRVFFLTGQGETLLDLQPSCGRCQRICWHSTGTWRRREHASCGAPEWGVMWTVGDFGLKTVKTSGGGSLICMHGAAHLGCCVSVIWNWLVRIVLSALQSYKFAATVIQKATSANHNPIPPHRLPVPTTMRSHMSGQPANRGSPKQRSLIQGPPRASNRQANKVKLLPGGGVAGVPFGSWTSLLKRGTPPLPAAPLHPPRGCRQESGSQRSSAPSEASSRPWRVTTHDPESLGRRTERCGSAAGAMWKCGTVPLGGRGLGTTCDVLGTVSVHEVVGVKSRLKEWKGESCWGVKWCLRCGLVAVGR